MNRATAEDVAREMTETGAPEVTDARVIDDGYSGYVVLVQAGGGPMVIFSAEHASAVLAHYKPTMFAAADAEPEAPAHTYEVGT